MHEYKIKYSLKKEIGNFKREDIDIENGEGATDAYVFFSILYPEDGSYSQTHISIDGRTGDPLSRNELFKLWLTLSTILKDSKELPEWKQVIASTPFDMFKEFTRVGKK